MHVVFFVKGDLQQLKTASNVAEGDVLVMSFEALGEVSYDKELKGEITYFDEI